MQEQHVTLHSTHGGSDKIYKLWLFQNGAGDWQVDAAWGPRRPFPRVRSRKRKFVGAYSDAAAQYAKIKRSKMTGGSRYQIVSDTAAVATVPASETQEEQFSDIVPNIPVETKDPQEYLDSPVWYAQKKHNGERLLIDTRGNTPIGINKRGATFALTQQQVRGVPSGAVLDTEAVGDKHYAFDLLFHKGEDVRQKPFAARFEILLNEYPDLLPDEKTKPVEITATLVAPANKYALYRTLERHGAEGLVFKRNSARYGDSHAYIKFKFWKTADVIVIRQNEKSSVAIGAAGPDGIVDVGNVTIYANQEMPREGQVIEVRYLYYYPNGSLFQPKNLGIRNQESIATLESLHVKPEEV